MCFLGRCHCTIVIPSEASEESACHTLIRDGDRVFVQQGDELKPVEGTQGATGEAAMPGSGYLDYLVAAEDVETLSPEQLGDETLARYRFAVDGPRFADYMLALAEKQLQGKLPVGMIL